MNKDEISTEFQQCRDEGKDLSSVEAEFSSLLESDLELDINQRRAEALLDQVSELPMVEDYQFDEPSDLENIKAKRPVAADLTGSVPVGDKLKDKVLGGWLGRCSGCLLGKPAEGRKSAQIEKYLKAQGRWPLDRYFSLNAPDELISECEFTKSMPTAYEEHIDGMIEDDDTNYTVTGMAIVKQYGADFTPNDVAAFWLMNIPIFHVCTAERVAYRNLVNLIPPPYSAQYQNPYREWIGAQIRADFFGYVNPGNLERAAEYAWRDASISHVKNGIYGEMWVAAMIATAYMSDDAETVIRAGLSQIPARNRLTVAVEHIIDLKKTGASYEEAVADIRSRWDENKSHNWCHTISNAEIVAMALLWGENDLEKTLCYSIMPGFDTDCNGATSGSVLGVMLGASKLPQKWIAPLNDTLYTGVAGYNKVSISAMADETIELISRIS
ncbi:MAG: ADP-ribosylglycohydrolase family protein [Armatimonadota bacterium]